MAEVVLHPSAQSFPPGTQVKVYERKLPEGGGQLTRGAPPGAILSEPTVAASGALTVTGLTEGGRYVAWAVVAAVDRYLFFEVAKAAAGTESAASEATRKTYAATGVTGAASSSRWAGATASGHPTAGTFAVGDWTIDLTGNVWVCTVAGTPGTWSAPSGAGGALLAANNLSDLASAATARTNLGLGTAATQASTAFAQVANNLSDLAAAATARTNLGLGTAAVEPATAFAKTANNLSDLASAATARTNLGLGTAATQASTAFATPAEVTTEKERAETQEGLKLAKAANLSDVAVAATARTNLGLGTAATHAEGDFAKTASNLSDLASAATARTNLGLGTAAVEAATAFAKTANNLSDVASPATSRENLRVPVLGACKAASSTNIATLEGTTTIDGTALEAGDTVLLTGQTESKNNGPWVIAAGAWTRPEDFSTGFELKNSRLILVLKGTVNALTTWAIATTGTITVGTTAHEWSRLAGPEIAWKAVEGLSAKLTNVSLVVGVLNGIIYLVGEFEVKEECAAAALLFTLPAGARPEKAQLLQLVGSTSTFTSPCTVSTAGEVKNIAAIKVAASPCCANGILRLH